MSEIAYVMGTVTSTTRDKQGDQFTRESIENCAGYLSKAKLTLEHSEEHESAPKVVGEGLLVKTDDRTAKVAFIIRDEDTINRLKQGQLTGLSVGRQLASKLKYPALKDTFARTADYLGPDYITLTNRTPDNPDTFLDRMIFGPKELPLEFLRCMFGFCEYVTQQSSEVTNPTPQLPIRRHKHIHNRRNGRRF